MRIRAKFWTLVTLNSYNYRGATVSQTRPGFSCLFLPRIAILDSIPPLATLFLIRARVLCFRLSYMTLPHTLLQSRHHLAATRWIADI